MMTPTGSRPDTTSEHFFEEKYRAAADPWNFAGDAYEQSRYDRTFAALAGSRYARAFEPGCSVGVLTARLATICDNVEAWDISPSAVQQARQRCRDLGNVTLRQGTLSTDSRVSGFDLVVFSEVGYYFNREALAVIAGNLVRPIPAGGTFLAVHWLGHSPDHLLSGDQVHEVLHTLQGLTLEHSERHERFRLDRWRRV